jgi:hypothetical protein
MDSAIPPPYSGGGMDSAIPPRNRNM